jgi:DNA-binding protein H-NS
MNLENMSVEELINLEKQIQKTIEQKQQAEKNN